MSFLFSNETHFVKPYFNDKYNFTSFDDGCCDYFS